MKRIAIAMATGALGVLLLAPCVNAQSWEDMQNDQAAIDAGHQELHHDRQELREDLRHGDYAAAAHEQAEMSRRYEQLHERQEDLNNDIANQYYHDGDYGWHPYNDEDDE
jgi:outer membrane murein-binding lipoprotein Lpp